MIDTNEDANCGRTKGCRRAPGDRRLGDLLGTKLQPGITPRVALLGFPSDEGVKRNGGRAGAAAAPSSVREELFRFTPDARRFDANVDLLQHSLDMGDLRISGNVREDQLLLGETVGALLMRGIFPIIIGGGHETSFGHFLGYVVAARTVSILNWDAHTDVRMLRNDEPHSGSPFYEAITHPSGLCRRYSAIGLSPHAVAREHLTFICEHGGSYTWRDDISVSSIDTLFDSPAEPVLATFDLDVVDQSQAPGVSAPAVAGLDSRLWLYAAFRAGCASAVTSFDLVELNPRLDSDRQSIRLGALTIWSVLSGLSERVWPSTETRSLPTTAA
jgi:formiminoglutamase